MIGVGGGTTSTSMVNSSLGSRKPSNEENTGIVEDEEGDFLEEDVIDLRSISPIGPLVVIDLIQLPYQAKEIKGWTVQQGVFQISQNICNKVH